MTRETDPPHPTWADQLAVLLAEIAEMPPGVAKDAAVRRARRLEEAIIFRERLRPADDDVSRS